MDAVIVQMRAGPASVEAAAHDRSCVALFAKVKGILALLAGVERALNER